MKLYNLLLQMEHRLHGNISLEPFHEAFQNCADLQLPTRMNLHNHDFCRYIKKHDGNVSCALNKGKSMKLAACGHRFAGCCPYGMWELAQPVMFKNQLAAILYFGGFAQRRQLGAAMKYGAYHGKIPAEISPEKIALCRQLATWAAEFIRFELRNQELQRTPEPHKHFPPEYYLNKVQNFLATNFKSDIQLPDAAQLCHLSANYLSNFLKKETGKTFRQLLTNQRLIEAEVCLKYRPALSISEVAFQCGFTDSNYFSTVFKKALGCSPRAYRRTWQKLAQLQRFAPES